MTQVASLDPERHGFSQPLILEALEKLEKRQLLPVIELALVAVFVGVIAFDAHKTKILRIADATSVSKDKAANTATRQNTAFDVPIAIDQPPLPRVGARQDVAQSLIPIVPPTAYRDYPAGSPTGAAPAPSAAPPSAVTAPAGPGKPGELATAGPAAPVQAKTETPEATSNGAAATASIEPGAQADVAGKPATPAAPTITEARLHPEDKEKALVPDKMREQKDFSEAFLSASRMLERRLTPEERAASLAPDYVDAMQRIEGFYDPTRVGPFGDGLRMQIRPGTMSMTDVFGERWTRAYPDPNLHYRVDYHAESWLRPRSHKCEDFWRFRTSYSPVALEKLGPADCAHIRADAESDNRMLAESSIVAAPLSVPAFAAPYPGSRMTHDELMAALRARADAAREQMWYGRAQGAIRRPIASRPKPALAPADETPKDETPKNVPPKNVPPAD